MLKYILHTTKVSSIVAITLANLKNSQNKSNLHLKTRRANIDLLYSNEDDEDNVEINPIEQDRKLKEAMIDCSIKMASSKTCILCLMQYILIKFNTVNFEI